MKIIQSVIRAFTAPTAHEKARIELQRAQSSLLEAHSAKEYAQAMVLYHDTRIARLSAYLNQPAVVEPPKT